MGLSELTEKAKGLLSRRGGAEAVKEDVHELKDIGQAEGTPTSKAEEAFEAIKDPGAPGDGGENRS